jgi:hypothetical protein
MSRICSRNAKDSRIWISGLGDWKIGIDSIAIGRPGNISSKNAKATRLFRIKRMDMRVFAEN